MSETDTILLLIVATGYLLAIQKKQPPILTDERLLIKQQAIMERCRLGRSFYVYYNRWHTD